MLTPAPDFKSLYDFETQLEAIFAKILTAGGVVRVYTSRDIEAILTPAVVLRAVTGSPAMQRTLRGTPVRLVPNAYEATILVEIITGRRLPDAHEHGPLRGLVRYLLSPEPNQIDETNAPWVQVLEILPAGGTPEMTDDKEQDRSVLQFAVKFVVRDTAWPLP